MSDFYYDEVFNKLNFLIDDMMVSVPMLFLIIGFGRCR